MPVCTLDWSRTETYEGTTNIVREHFGAYNMGIDYAGMVHEYDQRAKYPHKVIQPKK